MIFYLGGEKLEGSDKVYNRLTSLTLPISSDIKDQLVEIFSLTEDNRVRDKIAIIFADLADEHLVPILIKKINEIKYSKHISTLIYACSEYDCARWIDFFIQLIIDLDDSSYLEAISVVEGIQRPIKLSDKVICIKHLSSYLSSLNIENEKYEDVVRVLELVDNMHTFLD